MKRFRKKQSKFAGKLIVIIILFVFVGSLFAITQFSGGGDDVTGSAIKDIGGYAFYEDSGVYIAQDYGVGFLSNPAELGGVDINHDASTLLSGPNLVYITYNPNELAQDQAWLSYAELNSVLTNFAGKTVVQSFTEDQSPPNPDVPLHTCADAGAGVGVIELRLGGAAGVDVEGGCIVVRGEDEQAILRAASKLAMSLVGIEL